MSPKKVHFSKPPSSGEDFPQLSRSNFPAPVAPSGGRRGRDKQVASASLEQSPTLPVPQCVVQPHQEPAADSPEIQLPEPASQPPAGLAVHSQLTPAPPEKTPSPPTKTSSQPPSQLPAPQQAGLPGQPLAQPASNAPSHPPPTKPPSLQAKTPTPATSHLPAPQQAGQPLVQPASNPPSHPPPTQPQAKPPTPSQLPAPQQVGPPAQPLAQPASNPSSQTSVPLPTPSQAQQPVFDDELVHGSALNEARRHFRTDRLADAMQCCVHFLRQIEHEAPGQAALLIIEKSIESWDRSHEKLICDIESEKMSLEAKLNWKQDKIRDLKAAATEKQMADQRELQRVQAENRRIEGENKRLQGEKTQDWSSVREDNAIRRLQVDYRRLEDEMQRQNRDLQQEIDHLRENNRRLREQPQQQDRRLQEEIGRLREENRRLQQQPQQPDRRLQQDIDRLQQLIEDLQEKNKRLQKQPQLENRRLQQNIDRLRDEIMRLQQQPSRPHQLRPEEWIREVLRHELMTLRGLTGGAREKAKRALMMKWHPDKNPGASLATMVAQEMQGSTDWAIDA